MKAKRILAIFVVMLLVAVAVPLVASAQSSQTWYPGQDTATDSGADYKMFRGDIGPSGGAVITIDDGLYKVWTADEAATVNVGFPAASWSYAIYTGACWNETIRLEVGYWDTSFHVAAGSKTLPTEWGHKYTGSFDVDAFTVPDGRWLAYKITNLANVDGGPFCLVVTDYDTYIASPATDPGYPVPELPTIALLSAGMVGLAGYFVLKRRNRDYLKA